MPGETVKVDHLRLRVQGIATEEGRPLGQEICRQIADGLPAEITVRHLGALELRLPMPSDHGPGDLPRFIADTILGKIV